jgi:ABC-type sugar transport system ATPase subunit
MPVEWMMGTAGFEKFSRVLDLGENAREVVIGFRPEDVRISDGAGSFEGEVIEIDRLGESTLAHTRVRSEQMKKMSIGTDELEDSLLVRLDADEKLERGDCLSLLVDPNRLLWFDPESGENLLKEQK